MSDNSRNVQAMKREQKSTNKYSEVVSPSKQRSKNSDDSDNFAYFLESNEGYEYEEHFELVSEEEEEEEDEYEEEEIQNPKILALQDLNDKNFLNIIRDSPSFLEPVDASAFFKIVLSHFTNSKLSTKVGGEILYTIRRLLHKKKILQVFADKNIIELLPFDMKEYSDFLFSIVFDLINLNPNLFSQEFSNKEHFLLTVRHNPSKALSLLSKFSQKFINEDEIDEPWYFLDILVYGASSFIIPELVNNYCSLILFLNRNSDEYRTARFANFWHVFTKYLELSEPSCHSILYTSLSMMLEMSFSDEISRLEVPIDQIVVDLHSKSNCEAALSFIIAFTKIDSHRMNQSNLISALLEASEKNIKATIVLMTLASNKAIAKTIIGDGNWALKDLPAIVDTLRLFLVIFSHQKLRSLIVELENFPMILNRFLVEFSSPGIITIVCTIVRRIPLNQQIARRLAKNGFITTFIKTALNNNDEKKISSHSLLLIVNTLAPYGRSADFLEIIPFIGSLLNDRNLCEIASYSAVKLANDKKCVKMMLKENFDDFFEKNVKKHKSDIVRRNAKKFLLLIDKE
ncbi:hypothetical protein TRFO_06851 [Tritrichomonas foetus]|uniref:Uncharacterized protein n=1 Tax=Tritrichomonas foetus TaxID=1144522 RepID=A0A1J4JVK7_9EUKA|nr:hypothetical protein TRFO_06851 [Tritrichomonas foetus]|eukprot:OHT03169.1 hypothetical protein TRFO_06851 [Tritrichomonas foetus]